MDDLISLTEQLLIFNLLRYLMAAFPAFVLFYIILKKRWAFKKIQSHYPKVNDYNREIIYSLITILIFVAVGLLLFATPLRNYNLQYHQISEYGWGYWFLSVLLMILLHDTYFYWTHRLMHHPKIFRYFHALHHESTNPSPWAAYAFHPLEGIVVASVIFPIAFLIPFHTSAIMTFLGFMIIYNVYGHLGYELFPKGFNKNVIGKWINTSVNHNQHHSTFTGNYGLYLLFWDRFMGTLREDYDNAYLAVDKKRNGDG